MQFWYAKKTSVCVSLRSAESPALISEFYVLHKNPSQPVTCVRESHGLGQKSILNRVKTMLIYEVIPEKQQQFAVIRRMHDTYQCEIHTGIGGSYSTRFQPQPATVARS
eukprot:COSAG02_NODE_48191_length_335_cov_1.097458_1_plen_108_part_01